MKPCTSSTSAISRSGRTAGLKPCPARADSGESADDLEQRGDDRSVALQPLIHSPGPLDRLSIGCYMAPNGRRRPADSMGGAAMRRFILSSVLTIAMLVLTAATVLADYTGPGI